LKVVLNQKNDRSADMIGMLMNHVRRISRGHIL
jgi:hypothetical protein